MEWQNAVMYFVGGALIYLAIKKKYEPVLLLPLGFGTILVNLPDAGSSCKCCRTNLFSCYRRTFDCTRLKLT